MSFYILILYLSVIKFFSFHLVHLSIFTFISNVITDYFFIVVSLVSSFLVLVIFDEETMCYLNILKQF